MRTLRRAALVACLLLPAACGRFALDEHVAATGIVAQPRRMIVLSRLGGGVPSPLADSFHAGLQSQLTACGVETRLELPDAMALNATTRFAALVQGFNPDSTLLIRQTIRSNGSTIAGTFIVTLHSQTEKRDLWKASLDVSPGVGAAQEFGANAAARLVQTMAADAVLRACPRPA